MVREKLVTIRQAATVAGVDEETLRKEIESGKLKGEKKNGWFFDEWFVHSCEIDGLKDRRKSRPHSKAQTAIPTAALTPTPPLESIWESIDHESDETQTSKVESNSAQWRREIREEYKDVTKKVAEEFMRPLLDKLEAQAAALMEKDILIETQRQQLLLLPDYEKRDEKNRQALATKEQQLDLFETKLDLLEEKFAVETEILKTRLVDSETAKIDKAEEAQILLAEVTRGEAEKVRLQQQMTDLEATIVELKLPWWKKILR